MADRLFRTLLLIMLAAVALGLFALTAEIARLADTGRFVPVLGSDWGFDTRTGTRCYVTRPNSFPSDTATCERRVVEPHG